MEITELIGTVRDSLTAKRVYGEPYEKNGLTVIPAASVRGGGGGGAGESPEGGGTGGGFGLLASPTGAWVITDGQVEWKPAVDVTKIVIMGQVVGLVALLVVRSVARELAGRRSGRVDVARLARKLERGRRRALARR
jgi:uncharacterized spore protein YtfJ